MFLLQTEAKPIYICCPCFIEKSVGFCWDSILIFKEYLIEFTDMM